jgi:hypothetical protein
LVVFFSPSNFDNSRTLFKQNHKLSLELPQKFMSQVLLLEEQSTLAKETRDKQIRILQVIISCVTPIICMHAACMYDVYMQSIPHSYIHNEFVLMCVYVRACE